MARMSVEVKGLKDLERLPGRIDRGKDDFLRRGADSLARAVGEAAPGGRGGVIGRSFEGDVLTGESILIYSKSPAVKGYEVGAYAGGRPIGPFAHPIAYRDPETGKIKQTTFLTRTRGRFFVKPALRKRRRVMDDAFKQNMDPLPQ